MTAAFVVGMRSRTRTEKKEPRGELPKINIIHRVGLIGDGNECSRKQETATPVDADETE